MIVMNVAEGVPSDGKMSCDRYERNQAVSNRKDVVITGSYLLGVNNFQSGNVELKSGNHLYPHHGGCLLPSAI